MKKTIRLLVLASMLASSAAWAQSTNIKAASGSMIDLGKIADAAATAGSTGTLSAKLRLMTTQLDSILAGVVGPVVGVSGAAQSSSNPMGWVNINQTTPGTTNGVDPTTPASWGIVATGAAPPAKGVYITTNQSGATGGHIAGLISCDNHVFKHITSATDTLAVQGVASQTIYICGWRSRAAGVATWFLENTGDTAANCSASKTQITGVATEAANTGETTRVSFWDGLKNTSGNGLCINSTGTGGVDVDIWFTQF